MKAYKVFNPDWTCRGFPYQVGETYEIEGEISPCNRGFHACEKLISCFSYYSFDPKNKVAEVELLGEVVGDSDKKVTNKILIVKELTWPDVLSLVDSGDGNSGDGNSGDRNSGYGNSGNRNSGDFNSTTPEYTYFFNKQVSYSELQEIRNSPAYRILQRFSLVKYRVRTSTGKFGDFRHLSYKKSWSTFWGTLSLKDKKAVCTIPHFDKTVFQEITGIDTTKYCK